MDRRPYEPISYPPLQSRRPCHPSWRHGQVLIINYAKYHTSTEILGTQTDPNAQKSVEIHIVEVIHE